MNETLKLTPSEFISATNQTLEYAYAAVCIVGEVASFKVNQGKWVFFDIKDAESSVACFMSMWNLRMPLEDGMKVLIAGTPKLTKRGKFSVTVQPVRLVGEGSLRRAYEMLKKKLADEGLFAAEKKRKLPERIERLGVISSTQAAGYADFVKIMNARWGGIKISVAHTQVQGASAADQIMRALSYFNERGEVEVIAILRGGGSADDLACFNDEQLVRAIVASKIPVITGVGHEVDESLADLAADVRASTPSNAAEILTPDRETEIRRMREMMTGISRHVCREIEVERTVNAGKIERAGREVVGRVINPQLQKVEEQKSSMRQATQRRYDELKQRWEYLTRILKAVNPEQVLAQGYAIVAGRKGVGDVVKITTMRYEMKAEIKEIKERS